MAAGNQSIEAADFAGELARAGAGEKRQHRPRPPHLDAVGRRLARSQASGLDRALEALPDLDGVGRNASGGRRREEERRERGKEDPLAKQRA